VLAFMQHFPREVEDVYDASLLQAVAGLGAQLVGAMVIAPAVMLAGRKAEDVAAGFTWVTGVGEQIGMWEIDTGLSPILLVCLVAAAIHLVMSRQARASWRLDGRQQLALAATVVIAWVLVEATLARGLVYPWLKSLPILKSLHVNPRVAATFIMPLSIVGAVCVNQWQTTPSRRRLTVAAIVAAIACPAIYLLLPGKMQQRTFDVGPTLELAGAIRDGARVPITSILHLPDSDALIAGGSSDRPYEPLFGYGLETFAGEIVPGEVRQIRDGHFNMTHPASLVFPAENGLRVFERIPASDPSGLEAFAARRQPPWGVPARQAWLNAIAIVGLVACLVAIVRDWRSPLGQHDFAPERGRG